MLTTIFFAVFTTAMISGIFGMAGGMMLMGVCAFLLPVPTAMVLHGVTQLAANGFRSYLFRKNFVWKIIRYYLVGALCSLAIFSAFAFMVNKTTLFLVLGGGPVVIALIPKLPALNIENRLHAISCGLLATAGQLTAGVSGPLLDIFFVKTNLTRHQVVGTKAITQTCAHILKMIYFIFIVNIKGMEFSLPFFVYPTVIVLAVLGTRTGKIVLEKLNDQQFRRASQYTVTAVGLVYLSRGIYGLFYC